MVVYTGSAGAAMGSELRNEQWMMHCGPRQLQLATLCGWQDSVLQEKLQTCAASEVLNPSYPRPVRAPLPGLCRVADPVGGSAGAPSSRASPQIPSFGEPIET